jgi:hypothetical protein
VKILSKAVTVFSDIARGWMESHQHQPLDLFREGARKPGDSLGSYQPEYLPVFYSHQTSAVLRFLCGILETRQWAGNGSRWILV